MKKNKRKTLIISILVVVVMIIVVAISVLILYLSTDMFKSNQTLFLKYFGKNTEIIKNVEKIFENTEYENILENSKYSEEIQIKVNYTKDYGTTSENTNNSINNLKLTIDGQVDNVNKYNYKDFKLLKDNEQVFEVECIQNNNTYGIRFSDLYKQYLLVENNNLKELFRKMDYSEEKLEDLSDTIEINKDYIENSLKLSDQEIENLKEKYLNLINGNFSKENFRKESNQVVSINQKDIVANAYVLRLTKEQLNNIYINVLENFKNEEIVLRKIDNIQENINKSSVNSSETINLKDEFIQEIENLIEKINRNNIGTEETKIIVYENQGETIRTTIQGIDYQVNLDYIKTEKEQYIDFSLEEKDDKLRKISITKNDKKISFNMENKENNNPIIVSVESNNHIENNSSKKDISIKYESEKNKLEGNIIINTNIVDDFENAIIFDDGNSIRMNELDKEKFNAILNRVSEEVKKKLEEVNQEIKIEDLQQVLIDTRVIKDSHVLEGEGISELEKNRFNSKFEIIEGENVDSKNMLTIFEGIKENIIDLETVSNNELKIKISKEDKNENLIKALEDFIKNSNKRKYNAKVEYDEETGLVKYVLLTIVDE